MSFKENIAGKLSFTFFIFSIFTASAQISDRDIEKLQSILKKNPENYTLEYLILENQIIAEKNYELLNDLYSVHVEYLMNKNAADSAIVILHKMLNLSKEDETYGLACLILASAFNVNGNYDSLVYWHNKAEKYISPGSPLFGKYLLESGYKSTFDGSYTLAIETTLEAVKIFEATRNFKDLSLAYISLAYDYERLGNYKKQNTYLLKALEISKKLKDSFYIVANYNYLGVNYKKQHLLKKAMMYFDLAYEELKKGDYPMLLAQNLTNRGNVLEQIGEYDKAEKLFLECEQVSKKSNIVYGQMISYLNLGNLKRLQKKYDAASKQLEQALALSIELKSKREEALAYELISQLARDKADFKSAYEYQILYHTLNDSLVNESVKKESLLLSEKYETEKKEKKIISLSNDKLRQNYVIGLMGCGILGLIIFLQWWRFKLRNDQNKRVRDEQQMKHKIEMIEKELLADSLKKISVMNMKESVVKDLQEVMKDFPEAAQPRLLNIIHNFESQLDKSVIQEFETRFLGIYEDFFKKLKVMAPDLTPTELRVAALVRLNFTSKEMAIITKRSLGTIDNMRSSIRKKLQLNDDVNLVQTLLDI